MEDDDMDEETAVAEMTAASAGLGEDETLGLPLGYEYHYELHHPRPQGGGAAFDKVPHQKWNAPLKRGGDALPRDYQAGSYGELIPPGDVEAQVGQYIEYIYTYLYIYIYIYIKIKE
jgi:hypothetical protein